MVHARNEEDKIGSEGITVFSNPKARISKVIVAEFDRTLVKVGVFGENGPESLFMLAGACGSTSARPCGVQWIARSLLPLRSATKAQPFLRVHSDHHDKFPDFNDNGIFICSATAQGHPEGTLVNGAEAMERYWERV
ncbi:hypothetical protein AGABI2DRAFT_179894 [Agaricus bisporus var. bisporus H97]|uniref:hypothetical protein n=1 Tax=Agaricus bisporus var. bisporus (strain H97 / ATCC MYA-4626 / FGSC 10389) TaxID=936046 RepID=UPI00029F59E6|nr:hypothetical protein AGABI2DRAFT_179894 [Agaricus bisporus var. bisporus H97]EKV45450.1 hypothetical protein AGABI2DRAFT_179894 [Agaricus bisporus var. bisporus H97]